jgi:hypothetical protein
MRPVYVERNDDHADAIPGSAGDQAREPRRIGQAGRHQLAYGWRAAVLERAPLGAAGRC